MWARLLDDAFSELKSLSGVESLDSSLRVGVISWLLYACMCCLGQLCGAQKCRGILAVTSKLCRR